MLQKCHQHFDRLHKQNEFDDKMIQQMPVLQRSLELDEHPTEELENALAKK